MNRRLFCAVIALSSLWSSAAFGQAQRPPSDPPQSSSASYDTASFLAELHRLAAVLKKNPSTNEMVALRDSLPRRWIVSTPEFTCSVSSEPLRNQLTSLSASKALVWVNHLAAEVQASSSPRTALPQARSELDRILARPEFAAVRPPSAWDLLRERIAVWVGRMLLWLFSGLDRHPIGGKILFWLIVVGVVTWIAFGLFRFLTSRDRMAALPQSAAPVTSRTWQEWIRAAREAAGRSDFREAVHSAYWAGIARLEDAGVVPHDRTKTPREYLRLVTEPVPGELAPQLAPREPLAGLTSRLERVWYANRGASLEDFHESLRQLEALGCPLE
jgi:hypothetical protein